jgi:hypothetical protein
MYAVWEPILETDDERAARKATVLLADPRVEHFWVSTRDVGKMFQDPIKLTTEPAWDVYLVYPRGVYWDQSPPTPAYFMHQLRGRLPDEGRLDAKELSGRLGATLRDGQDRGLESVVPTK